MGARRPSLEAGKAVLGTFKVTGTTAAKHAKRFSAASMQDVTCRWLFPLLYLLFVITMLALLPVYDHYDECVY